MSIYQSSISCELHWRIASYLDKYAQDNLKLVCKTFYSMYGDSCTEFEYAPRGYLQVEVKRVSSTDGMYQFVLVICLKESR